MKSSELESMSSKELRALKDRVDQALPVAVQREKAELKAKMAALAAEHGMSLSDLFEGPKSRKSAAKGASPIKFRNPKNADETWTGRGRRPAWLVDAGGDHNRFRIG